MNENVYWQKLKHKIRDVGEQFSRDRCRIDEAEARQGRGRGRWLEAEARPRHNV